MKLLALLFLLTSFSILADDLPSIKLEAKAQFKINRRIGYNDIWGYTDANGREYALLGVQDGTSIVDVTDLNNLKEIVFFSSARSTWKDIKTYGHYAYVVNESSGGMQIIDLSKLPASAEIVATFTDFQTSHNIHIDTKRGILFAEGNHSAPVRVYSLANPTAPELLSTLGVECHDIFSQDGLLYVSEGGHGTIGIFNYDDPRNPTLVSRFQIPRAGYVHNAWATYDGRYLMTTEENSGKTMKMWDLGDLENITLMSEIIAPGKLAHNTHIKGNFAYVSHYGSGLRIYDISKPEQMLEVAYWMKSETARSGFVSAWGAYPFFKSGKILVSDIEDGLIVVTHESAVEAQ